MSVTHKSNLKPDKPEADGAGAHFTPYHTGFYSYLNYTERTEVETRILRKNLGIKLGISRTDGRALTNCANPRPLLYKSKVMRTTT